MIRTGIFVLALLPAALPALAHPGGESHDHGRVRDSGFVVAQQADPAKTSGQGELVFRVLYTASHLPAAAQPVLVSAHGGFAIDRREGKGETYFALPGAGIIQISGDLSKTAMVSTPEEMAPRNMHNTTIWYDGSGEPRLVFPSNDAQRVYTTTLDGKLLHTLAPPGAFKFDAETVNAYFANNGPFVPTDVDYLGGVYYITTGYSALDWVLTAQVTSGAQLAAVWDPLAFGGKGGGPGQFGTGHGVTIPPSNDRVDVADRPNSEIDRFTPEGKYVDTVALPAGSLPCDIDYAAGYAIVGCLEGPDKSKGAPIYILKDDKLVSTIMPKEELGLEKFTHIHNAVLRSINGKLFIIAQAWNPGDFAILEQVK